MDNVSKALILAGGILLGVMVVSISMYMIATARGVARESNQAVKQSAIESFNRFYESFDSTITAIDVVNIYNRTVDINDRYDKGTSDHRIAMDSMLVSKGQLFNGNGDEILGDEKINDSMLEGETFTFRIDGTDSDGYINSISIQ